MNVGPMTETLQQLGNEWMTVCRSVFTAAARLGLIDSSDFYKKKKQASVRQDTEMMAATSAGLSNVHRGPMIWIIDFLQLTEKLG